MWINHDAAVTECEVISDSSSLQNRFSPCLLIDRRLVRRQAICAIGFHALLCEELDAISSRAQTGNSTWPADRPWSIAYCE